MNEFILIKLISGETIMATLIEDLSDKVVVNDPLAIKTIHVQSDGGMVERTITNPLCGLSDEREYMFFKDHIIFIKSLSPRVTEMYEKFVDMMNQDYETYSEDYVEEPKKKDSESILIIPDNETIH